MGLKCMITTKWVDDVNLMPKRAVSVLYFSLMLRYPNPKDMRSERKENTIR